MGRVNDNKPFYQPWDEDAFHGGERVRGMTHIQKWIYKSLLLSSFQCETRPYLPDDDDRLRILAGCGSKQEWLDNREDVMACFDERHPENPKLFSHHRVLADWKRIAAYRRAMQRKGRASAEARAAFSGRSPQDEHTLNERSTKKEVKEIEINIKESEREENIPLSLSQFADKVL